MSESRTVREIVIQLPQNLLMELDGYVQEDNVTRNELLYRATKMYIHDRRKRKLRDEMKRGYIEMAAINLTIASEAFLAEYEAEHCVERLVSGG
ncbi:antitoxin endoai [Bacillus sp. 1P06AnD]|uniref:antitoxin endoai n=1 Tax=Bacillus sp. 1P06AnD TaxID=3132208 RepID=UPI00399FBB4F